MSREARRGILRILCNYARLFSTLLLGIALVPLTIAWLGDDAFGLIALLGANIGLANVVRQITQQSLVRELGAAYHGGDEAMRRAFPAICRIALIAAALTFLAFCAIAALVPVFRMPDEFRRVAVWFILIQGVQSSYAVFLSPVLNMHQVTERFVSYSAWIVAARATNIVSVVALGYVVAVEDPVRGLLLYCLLSSALTAIVYTFFAVRLVRIDPRLTPTLRRPEPGAVKEVFGTFSWNSGVQIALNLHDQIPPMLLNLAFGTVANAAWGVGFRLVAYIRMVTTGMQFGSDAVSARLSANADPQAARRSLQHFVGVQSRLTCLVSLPATAGVLIYCFPLLHAWVGPRLGDYDAIMGMAVVLARILALAIAARAVSDTWVLILYGSGYIRSYAPLVFAGGIIAPVIAIVLLKTLPEPYRFTGPAIAFTAVILTLHLFGIAIVAGRCLHISSARLLLSLTGPVAATAIASAAGLAVLAAGGRLGDLALLSAPTRAGGRAIDPFWMLGSIATFGLVYAPLAYALVLGPNERQRLNGLVARRLPFRRAPA